MSNPLKTAAIVIICVVALALAVWSGYRSFVPQGKVTYGGSFGSRDAERGADSTERNAGPGGSSGMTEADPLSGAPAQPIPGGR